jgi:6-phosphogluconolactonase
MQIEVYPTDAEAMDAAAAVVAERVRVLAGGGRATVALGGSRSGRALMVALAARGDLPWGAVEWFLADERCGGAADPLAHAKVARDSLLGPRGIAAARIHVPALDGAGAADVAARYGETLASALGPDGVFDVVVLGIGGDGALGSLVPASAALDAAVWVAVVPAADGREPARVSITPTLIERARHVIVTAVGPETAPAVRAALRDGAGPAARALPSTRVTWVVDRDAAAGLLQDATQVPTA